jgi:hypothetical protein
MPGWCLKGFVIPAPNTSCNMKHTSLVQNAFLLQTLSVIWRSYGPSNPEPQWNWVWFSELELGLEFIFSKNWTWIPSSIYARKWNHNHSNSSDDDFIGPSLGGMGYYRRWYKRTISNCKFIRGRFQSGILQVCNVSKCPYGS